MENQGKGRRSFIQRLLSLPLRFKISIPYLIVASLLAGLAAYTVGRSFVETMEERFRSQLEDASARTAEGVIDLEAFHLQMIRTIAFTQGVPEAVSGKDKSSLEALVFPHVVNHQLYAVDLLDAEGEPLLSWHRQEGKLEYRQNEFMDYRQQDVVRAVLEGKADQVGDKFTSLVNTPWGLYMYTVGPIRNEEGRLGAVMVGTPVEAMIRQLALKTLANLTIYDQAGEPVVSTVGNPLPQPVDEAILTELPNISEILLTRRFQVGARTYIEAVESLYLRGEPSEWIIGVSLPEDLVREAQGPSTWQILTITTIGVLALVGLGVVVAQLIAVPVFRLLDASEKVGEGQFDIEVPVEAEDEIGLLTRSFNRMVKGLKQREFIREMFGRMVSADVREAILRNQVAVGGEIREVTVLFTDVRGFTALSEKNTPQDTIALLNEFFSIVTKATHGHQGVVNHFGGDSVLAVFGAPIARPLKDTIEQAVLTAIEIQRGVIELNARRIAKGLSPLRFGIGINSGPVIAGNIGSEDRFTYTVIGDVVNVAARLQGISRQFPSTPLLIPQSTLEAVKDALDIEVECLGDFALKGKEQPVPVCAIIGSTASIPPDFEVFTSTGCSNFDGLMACYLCCLAYPLEVIEAVMQVERTTLEDIFTQAARNATAVSQVLMDAYGLSQDQVERLLTMREQEGERDEPERKRT